MIKAAEIRQKYLDFFAERGHRVVASSPIVPPDDPTLLFTTAGMVQFKPYYTGEIEPPYSRAVTVQKCLRAGGKGSDLENVGRTLRHHTFFEMLGNFSFGDYFKCEAIEWAWEFCTGEKWLALPGDRIWATVYGKKDEQGEWIVDEDAERYWIDKTGVSNPIIRLDEAENFWGPAGGTGACGPCSEIKFFMGTDEELRHYQELARSGGEGMDKVVNDIVDEGDLFLEIWNLVFPQYDHQPDGARPPLKYRGIDTGAGLERVTTACQMIHGGGTVWSPYETDLLEPLINAVVEIAGLPYPRLRGGETTEAELTKAGHDPAAIRMAMNACADHARTLTFALSEGIVPSNEGRGYVIRRILRRAARFGKKIGVAEPFLWRLIDPVVAAMGEAYPEIAEHTEQIKKIVRQEEERFSRTLNLGSDMLDEALAKLGEGKRLCGEDAFRLYDTYGFPLDLAIEICEERGVDVDIQGYEKALAEGKAKARAAWRGGGAGAELAQCAKALRESGEACEFTGYNDLEAEATIKAILRSGEPVDSLEDGQDGIIVLDRTPFYGEGGGQIGDRGAVVSAEGSLLFAVEDAQKTDDGFVFHFGQAAARLEVGQKVCAKVDPTRRAETIKNHSATHLLQGALKSIVGKHVSQSGSWVGPEHLRFDFTNPEALGEKTLREIEAVVNAQIQRNLKVSTNVMDLEQARATGAIAPFGEKYGATVRVVQMEDFSTEFCGGTHVAATGEIGAFIIDSESSVAAGIRRIEARTGAGASGAIAADRAIVARLARALSGAPEELVDRVAALQAEVKSLKREIEKAKAGKLADQSESLASVDVNGVSVCVAWIDDLDAKALRSTFDNLKSKHGNEKFVAVLGSGGGGKASLIVGATPDLAGSAFEAGKLVRELAPLFDGRGGGKAQFAQAGGKDAEKLKSALKGGKALEIVQSA